MKSIDIALNAELICKQVISFLLAGEKTLISSLNNAIREALKSEFSLICTNFLKKEVEVKIYGHSAGGRQVLASLKDLLREGYEAWGIVVKIIAKNQINFLEIDDISINPNGFFLEEISYGFGIKRTIQIKKKSKKTQTNYIIELLHFKIAPRFFEAFKLEFEKIHNIKNLIMCNLNEKPAIRGLQVVSFIEMLSGRKFFCACSNNYHKYVINQCEKIKSRYSMDSWPYKLIDLLENAVYKEKLCHLCVAKEFGAEKSKSMYDDKIHGYQLPYICQIIFEQNLTKRTALAEINVQLGISKWKQEALLYVIIKSIFRGFVIEREASPTWLGRQRLDIFLPEKKLAIEYQGEQHYRPIPIFGGEATFEELKIRDKLKLEKCKENGVKLVYFSFKETISEDYVRKKLHKYVPQIHLID